MAWVSLGSANLVDGSTTRGYAHFEYDNSSGTTSRPCRIRISARSGYTFNVIFRNITVGGTNYGTVSSVTQSSGTIWSGNITAGRNVTATWENPWYNGTKTPSITGYLPAGGSAPSGASIQYVSSTWNSVTAVSSVTSWGGLAGQLQTVVVMGSSAEAAADINADNWASSGRNVYRYDVSGTSVLSHQFVASEAATHNEYDNPIDLKGMRSYKLAAYNWNSAGTARAFDNTLRYTPPAPSQFSCVDQGGTGTKTYAVSFVGDTTSNNSAYYEQAYLTRTVRYKIDNGAWTYVVNNVVTLLGDTTDFNVVVPAASTATIEGWMTYHGMQSQVVTVSVSNTNSPVHLYGSVNGQAKEVKHVYGSVNGQRKKITKLYASVGGVAKRIFEDV